MDYAFRRREKSSDGARRIAREQLEEAILELEGARDTDAAVHGVRKRLKKLRSLLRLLRTELGDETFVRENAALGSTARLLAGPRRGAATLGAFDALMARHPDAIDAESQERLRAKLEAERDQLVNALCVERLDADVVELLRACLERVGDWPVGRDGWKGLGGGFERSYAQARRAYRAARQSPSTERLHSWRTRAKHHAAHVRLLGHLWPQAMKALERTLDEMTEDLGDEHDLDDLRCSLIERMPPAELAAPIAQVLELIEARRDTLRQRAFRRAERVFAERPRALRRRFAAYWAAWQREVEE
jgi:CHAD domain-containing protein